MKKVFHFTDDEMDFIYDLLMFARESSFTEEDYDKISSIIQSIDDQTNYYDHDSD